MSKNAKEYKTVLIECRGIVCAFSQLDFVFFLKTRKTIWSGIVTVRQFG